MFSAVSGVLGLCLKHDVAASLALPSVVVVLGAWLLVAYAAILYAHSISAQISARWTRVVIGLDLAWVVGSGLLAALHQVRSVTPIAVIAATVLTLAGLQWRGLTRMEAPASPTPRS